MAKMATKMDVPYKKFTKTSTTSSIRTTANNNNSSRNSTLAKAIISTGGTLYSSELMLPAAVVGARPAATPPPVPPRQRLSSPRPPYYDTSAEYIDSLGLGIGIDLTKSSPSMISLASLASSSTTTVNSYTTIGSGSESQLEPGELPSRPSSSSSSSNENMAVGLSSARTNVSAIESKETTSRNQLIPAPARPSTPPKHKLSEQELVELFQWIDCIPFKSKTKNNIHRDFADAVLLAELIHHYIPKLVSLHSYSHASGMRGKINNWETLNSKVLTKIGIPSLCASDVFDLANAKDGAIQVLLMVVRDKLEAYRHSKKSPAGDSLLGTTSNSNSTSNIININSYSNSSLFDGRYPPRSPSSIYWHTLKNTDSNTSSTSSDWSSFSPVSSTTSLQHQQNDCSYRGVFEDTCTIHAIYENSKVEERSKEVLRKVEHVIYNGRKLVPEELIESYQSRLEVEHETNQGLQTKIKRLETLVSLKEDRLEDMTKELHELKQQIEQYRSERGRRLHQDREKDNNSNNNTMMTGHTNNNSKHLTAKK